MLPLASVVSEQATTSVLVTLPEATVVVYNAEPEVSFEETEELTVPDVNAGIADEVTVSDTELEITVEFSVPDAKEADTDSPEAIEEATYVVETDSLKVREEVTDVAETNV